MTLNPDLRDSVRDDGDEQIIDHPFMRVPGYTPDQDDQINEAFVQKKNAIEYARKQADWPSLIELYSEHSRLSAFVEFSETLDDASYASLFSSAWCESNHIYISETQILATLKQLPPSNAIMRDDERKALDALPNKITVYRGYGADRPERKLGMSWSTVRDEAIRMAYDYHCNSPRVLTGTCAKADVIAHFLRRKEYEILVDPGQVDVTDNEELPPRNQLADHSAAKVE